MLNNSAGVGESLKLVLQQAFDLLAKDLGALVVLLKSFDVGRALGIPTL
jgi:hypothetical protein